MQVFFLFSVKNFHQNREYPSGRITALSLQAETDSICCPFLLEKNILLYINSRVWRIHTSYPRRWIFRFCKGFEDINCSGA